MKKDDLIKETIDNVRKHVKSINNRVPNHPGTINICGERRKHFLLNEETIHGDFEQPSYPKKSSLDKENLKIAKKNCKFENKTILNTHNAGSFKKVKLIVHVKNEHGLKNFKTTHSFVCSEEDIAAIILKLTLNRYKITKSFTKIL